MRKHFGFLAMAALAVGFATPALSVPSEGNGGSPAFALDGGALFVNPGPGTGTSPALEIYYDFAESWSDRIEPDLSQTDQGWHLTFEADDGYNVRLDAWPGITTFFEAWSGPASTYADIAPLEPRMKARTAAGKDVLSPQIARVHLPAWGHPTRTLSTNFQQR